MKKYFLSIVALAAMLFATSCQESLVEPQMEGPTTFTVQLPDAMGTKATIGGYELINRVYVEVYSADGTQCIYKPTNEDGTYYFDTFDPATNSATIRLNLIQDQEYDIVFWAQHGESYNVSDLTAVQMNNLHHNSETGAAFFAKLDNFTPGNDSKVELRRPFAQLNLGTTQGSLSTDAGNYMLKRSKITVSTVAGAFNTIDGVGETEVPGQSYEADIEFTQDLTVAGQDYTYVSMDYLPIPSGSKILVNIAAVIVIEDANGNTKQISHSFESVPVQENYRTNIVGNLISSTTDFIVEVNDDWAGPDYKYDSGNGNVTVEVDTPDELQDAFNNDSVDEIVLGDDIDLNDLFNQTKSEVTTEDPTLTIKAGKTLTIDLNDKKLSATSSQTGKNYNMFEVRGTLTVKNGTMEYKHIGENMLWNKSTNLFDVAAGGVLNLEGVTAKNLGGSDMGFVVHLNNWGEVTLYAENCTLESNYVPVRVFNSGPDMNNVTIKNSTLKGGSASFWVHNYTEEDFGSQAKADSQKGLLNLNIYNQGNEFEPDLNGLRYGFTNSIRTDAYGITKVVSEDGTEVTLGSLIENGLVRRGVAGTEENTTIKKVVVKEGITTLYDRTFRKFYALEEVVLPEGLTTIGEAGSGVFQSCTALKNIVIPESVNVLGKGTFQECSSLESINIPSDVTRIEDKCLRATGLVTVEFHAGVTVFGAQAFRACKQLTEVIIKAPEFTMEGNTFGIMAAPFTPMTIYVANSAMKTYVESKLTDHAKTYITVIAPTEVGSTTEINEALAQGEDVVLTDDIAVAKSEAESNGYGVTGISQLNGGVIDGNGNDISVDAWGTWDTAINTTGGTIKNLNVTGGMRGIFVNHNSTYSDKVILENVTIDGTIYTISCDQGTNKGLEAYNSTFNGWTSYAATIGNVKFDSCSFGAGQGYSFCRPYAPTEFVNCAFEAGYELDARAAVTFENCTIGDVALTAENLATFVTGGIANATIK